MGFFQYLFILILSQKKKKKIEQKFFQFVKNPRENKVSKKNFLLGQNPSSYFFLDKSIKISNMPENLSKRQTHHKKWSKDFIFFLSREESSNWFLNITNEYQVIHQFEMI